MADPDALRYLRIAQADLQEVQRIAALPGMEGTMTAVMGDHPATARHGARDQGVEQPKTG